MKALLDTNIVIDIFQKHDFDRDGLDRLYAMRAFGDVETWVSAKSYADVFYFLRKELGSERAHDAMLQSLTWLKTCSIDEDDIRNALLNRWSDFEDSLINVCAEKIKADYLITRDKNGFERSAIPHGSASEFMEFVFEQTNIRYDIEEGTKDRKTPARQ